MIHFGLICCLRIIVCCVMPMVSTQVPVAVRYRHHPVVCKAGRQGGPDQMNLCVMSSLLQSAVWGRVFGRHILFSCASSNPTALLSAEAGVCRVCLLSVLQSPPLPWLFVSLVSWSVSLVVCWMVLVWRWCRLLFHRLCPSNRTARTWHWSPASSSRATNPPRTLPV
jgi:hypothetical protein